VARSDKSSSPNSKQQSNAIKVDPQINRPANADEASPETLVPDVVRTHLTEERRAEQPSELERSRFIAERAYELAEQRGFTPGAELDDWLRAEQEFDAQMRRQARPEDQFTG
jgi:hypothetical protein